MFHADSWLYLSSSEAMQWAVVSRKKIKVALMLHVQNTVLLHKYLSSAALLANIIKSSNWNPAVITWINKKTRSTMTVK